MAGFLFNSVVVVFLASIFGYFVQSSKALGCGDSGEGWIQGSADFENYCYKILGAEVYDDPQYISFYQCKQDCNKLGGELASIHSEAENSLIYENLAGMYPPRKTLTGLKDDKWLDGTYFDFNKWYSAPKTFWDCAFIGGYIYDDHWGPFWTTGDCFNDEIKFDCACKKSAR